jgi:hypothetical protein
MPKNQARRSVRLWELVLTFSFNPNLPRENVLSSLYTPHCTLNQCISVSETVLLLIRFQTGRGFQPASYPICRGAPFSGVKRSEHEADHSLTSNSKVKNERPSTLTTKEVFLVWILRHWDNITLFFLIIICMKSYTVLTIKSAMSFVPPI